MTTRVRRSGIAAVTQARERFGTPWNGIGSDVTGLRTSREAIVAAKMDWTVEKQDTFWLKNGEIQILPDTFAIVRQDNHTLLGRVGQRYCPLQNTQAFEFFDAIIGEGRAAYDSAGTLFGGKRIWITAKLDEKDFVNTDDERERYVLLTNSFDGTTAVKMTVIIVRLWCTNQLNGLMRNSQFRVSHHGKIEDRVNEAKEALGLLTAETAALEKTIEKLRKMKMTGEQASEFAQAVGTNRYERESIEDLFYNGVGCDGCTRYDALNAVTQLTTHHLRGRGDERAQAERRMAGLTEGKGAKMQRNALELLIP